MMRHAAVATYVPSGYDGTGVVGKVGGGELGRSVAILVLELLKCRAIDAVRELACPALTVPFG